MCVKGAFKEPVLKHCLSRYKTQETCEKSVDACLQALKFVSVWFVTNNMLDSLDNTVFFNDNVGLCNVDSDTVTILLLLISALTMLSIMLVILILMHRIKYVNE